MNRIEFIDVLKDLSPAVDRSGLAPIFGCYCFDGKMVTAYNDVLLIQKPLKFPIPGGYSAQLLKSWVGSVAGDNIDITEDGDQVVFKCGKSTLTLPRLEPSEFLHEAPKKGKGFKASDALIDAIRLVLPCAGRDGSIQSHWLGVNLLAGIEKTVVLASNRQTFGRVLVGEKIERDLLLPFEFCDVITSAGGNPEISVGENSITATFKDGLTVFSKLGTPDADEVRETFTPAMLKDAKACLLAVPEGFHEAVGRATLVTGEKSPRIRLTVKKGKLAVTAESAIGRVHEVFNFAGEDIDELIDPNSFKPMMGRLSHIGLNETCFCGKIAGLTYMLCYASDPREGT